MRQIFQSPFFLMKRWSFPNQIPLYYKNVINPIHKVPKSNFLYTKVCLAQAFPQDRGFDECCCGEAIKHDDIVHQRDWESSLAFQVNYFNFFMSCFIFINPIVQNKFKDFLIYFVIGVVTKNY